MKKSMVWRILGAVLVTGVVAVGLKRAAAETGPEAPAAHWHCAGFSCK